MEKTALITTKTMPHFHSSRVEIVKNHFFSSELFAPPQATTTSPLYKFPFFYLMGVGHPSTLETTRSSIDYVMKNI